MDPALYGLVGVIVAALGGFVGVVWKLSGRIESSEAKDLWAESASIRTYLQARNEQLRKVLDECETRISDLEITVQRLLNHNEALMKKNHTLERLVEAHEHTIERLERENEQLRARVKELEARNVPPK